MKNIKTRIKDFLYEDIAIFDVVGATAVFGVQEYLYKIANNIGLEIVNIEKSTKFLDVSYRVTVDGDREKIEQFYRQMKNKISSHWITDVFLENKKNKIIDEKV